MKRSILQVLSLMAFSCLMAINIVQTQVYGSSRHRASANPNSLRSPGTGAGVMRSGQHPLERRSFGAGVVVPGNVHLRGPQAPGRQSSSGYRVYHRDAPHSYSHSPGHIQYSPRSGSAVVPLPPHPHVYHSHHSLHPYDHARIQAGLPIQYSLWLDYSTGYPAIASPPIYVPYNNLPFTSPTAPVPFQEFAPAPGLPAAATLPNPAGNDSSLSRTQPIDDQPVRNEFPAVPRRQGSGNAADAIRALRYQTSGDMAARRGDWSSAEVFYQSALDTDPTRDATRLRLVWAQVRNADFPAAASQLKAVMRSDRIEADIWSSPEEVMGASESAAASTNDDLWQWLEQRPRSTDRLLLVASFEQFHSHYGTAAELMKAAERLGLDAQLVNAFHTLKQRPAAPELDEAAARSGKQADDDILRLHGTKTIEDVQPGIPLPIEDESSDGNSDFVPLPDSRLLPIPDVELTIPSPP